MRLSILIIIFFLGSKRGKIKSVDIKGLNKIVLKALTVKTFIRLYTGMHADLCTTSLKIK